MMLQACLTAAAAAIFLWQYIAHTAEHQFLMTSPTTTTMHNPPPAPYTTAHLVKRPPQPVVVQLQHQWQQAPQLVHPHSIPTQEICALWG